jgi:hypothetical protein
MDLRLPHVDAIAYVLPETSAAVQRSNRTSLSRSSCQQYFPLLPLAHSMTGETVGLALEEAAEAQAQVISLPP